MGEMAVENCCVRCAGKSRSTVSVKNRRDRPCRWIASSSIFERLFSLKGKAALITGASGGIGHALADGLAEAGAAVAVHGRDLASVEETCRATSKRGARRGAARRVREHRACRRLVADTHGALGRIDILINCAATNRRKPIAEVTEDDYDTIMAANLQSVLFS